MLSTAFVDDMKKSLPDMRLGAISLFGEISSWLPVIAGVA